MGWPTYLLGRFFHRDRAALLAISERADLERAFALAVPPLRPKATAAALLPSGVRASSISSVAIRMTWTAFAITSAGRFFPAGVLGILTAKHIMCHSNGFRLPSRSAAKGFISAPPGWAFARSINTKNALAAGWSVRMASEPPILHSTSIVGPWP